MYAPFVLACNDALEKLSTVEIEGLPPYEPGKQIAFVCNHDRSVESPNHRRAPQVKPDIVLIHGSNTPTPPSESDSRLSWIHIRSTVEMKFKRLKRVKMPETFDKDFGALTEIPPELPLVGSPQPAFIPEEGPTNKCQPVSFPRFLPLIRLHRSRAELGETVGEETTRHRGNCA